MVRLSPLPSATSFSVKPSPLSCMRSPYVTWSPGPLPARCALDDRVGPSPMSGAIGVALSASASSPFDHSLTARASLTPKRVKALFRFRFSWSAPVDVQRKNEAPV